MLENPAVDVIRAIPSVWDQTIALPASEIGEVAALARRRGNDWFIAVMNGASARTIEVPLKFLGPGEYRSVLVRDSADKPDVVHIENATLDRNDSLKIAMQPGGGFVARLSRSN
jgi:alpha-glucosidase